MYVFDRLDCYWGGAPVLPHDFSYYGTGSKSRMLQFLPKNPYGMVTLVLDDIELSQHPYFTKKISTDGEYFYDEQGRKYSAQEYRPIVEKHLRDAARRLPILVEGDVAWSAVRIDDNHIRLVLIDKGYLDPSDRSAMVHLQNVKAVNCRDILSGEEIPIQDNSLKVNVPAGIFRVIDISHK